MKRKATSKEKFDREREIEFEEKEKDFGKKYDELIDSLEIADPTKRKEVGEMWFEPKEEFVKNQLEDWYPEQPMVYPQGKYRDDEEVYVTYQQKFVEVIRDVSPQVFEDLRSLIPNFKLLFGKDVEKYLEVIQNLKVDSFPHSNLSPNYKHPDFNYLWDDLRVLVLSTQYIVQRSTSEEKNRVSVPKELVIIFEEWKDCLKNESDYQQIYSRLLEYKFDSFKNLLKESFQETAIDENLILSNFFELQTQIYSWVDRYHLHKDWLIDYAYSILYQMSKNEDIPVKEIPILKQIYSPSTVAYDFVFKYQGWWASHKSVDEYEAIVREEFEKALDSYMVSAHSYLQLENKTKVTKPLSYDRVKWLVRWTVQKWSKEQIQAEIDRDFQNQDIEKYVDISTIDKAFLQFKKYDLPVRD